MITSIVLGLGALSAAGAGIYWYLYERNLGATNAMGDLAARYATRGPRGEYAFNLPTADALVRSLSAMNYEVQADPTMILVKTTGAPVPMDKSALGWVTRMNASRSILGSLLATQPPKPGMDIYLRAVDLGQESELAGPSGMYAVLAYAGAIPAGEKAPGTPPTTASGEVPLSAIDLANLKAELPADLVGPLKDLLQNGLDAAAMKTLAADFQSQGFVKTAAALLARAGSLLSGGPIPTPVITPVPPLPPPPPPPGPIVVVVPPAPVVNPPNWVEPNNLPNYLNLPNPIQPAPAPIYVQPTPAPAPVYDQPAPAAPATQNMFRVNTPNGPGLNVRVDALPSANRLGGVNNGTTVQVIDSTPDNTWAKVIGTNSDTGGSITGWVCFACPEGGSGAPFLTRMDDVPANQYEFSGTRMGATTETKTSSRTAPRIAPKLAPTIRRFPTRPGT